MLTARSALVAAKNGADGIVFEWDPDTAAPYYHLNAVTSKEELLPPTPFRDPVGSAIEACEATAPDTSCTHGDAIGGPPRLFYQVVSACGVDGHSEGPLN